MSKVPRAAFYRRSDDKSTVKHEKREVWFYRNPKTIDFHLDVFDDQDVYLQHISFSVPFSKLTPPSSKP